MRTKGLEKLVRGKVVVTGANGANGIETIKRLLITPGVTQLVGTVRNEDKKMIIEGRIIGFKSSIQGYSFPPHDIVIVKDEEPLSPDAQKILSQAEIFINWKGVSIRQYLEQNPELQDPNKLRDMLGEGKQIRDLLLEANIPIVLRDAELAFTASPNCMYIIGSNPNDVLVRTVHKFREFFLDVRYGKDGKEMAGHSARRTLSPGTLLEFYRWSRLVPEYLRQDKTNLPESHPLRCVGYIDARSVVGMVIGEHGRHCTPYNINLSGITLENALRLFYGDEWKGVFEEMRQRVTDEPHLVREWTGETPSEAPAAASVDLVRALFDQSQGSRFIAISRYIHKGESRWGPYEDIAFGLPVLLNRDQAVLVPYERLDLNDEHHKVLQKAAEHLRGLNARADSISLPLFMKYDQGKD
jgi:malate/lactate dehydrogenase